MPICPICSAPSAGKKIAFNNFEIVDMCVQCASFSICLISPNVEPGVKENAIRWANYAMATNREKLYIIRCLQSWKATAESYLPKKQDIYSNATAVIGVNTSAIDLDSTLNRYKTGDYSAVSGQQDKTVLDDSVLDIESDGLFGDLLREADEENERTVSREEKKEVENDFEISYEELLNEEDDEPGIEVEIITSEKFVLTEDDGIPEEAFPEDTQENVADTEPDAVYENEIGEVAEADDVQAEEPTASEEASQEEAAKAEAPTEKTPTDILAEMKKSIDLLCEKVEGLEKEIRSLRGTDA